MPHMSRAEALLALPTAAPPVVRERIALCVADLLATALGGATTRLRALAADFAVGQFAAGPGTPTARLLFDGRGASPAGAAFANAALIDSCDAHDGHAGPMGHAGVAVFPAALAAADAHGALSADRLVDAVLIGYEAALRAGRARTRDGASPLGSGAWNAIGAAAAASVLLRLDRDAFRHALGLADYMAPISPVERAVAHPTMVKDGAGPAAMAGVAAAYLAREGFTGAPAWCVEGEDAADYWRDLGERWEILSLNFKRYPTIKLAEPAIDAALALRREDPAVAARIERGEIEIFSAAAALSMAPPADEEAAQYALGFPVAAALVHGDLTGRMLSGEALRDDAVLALLSRLSVRRAPAFDADFPAEQPAALRIRLRDGTERRSPVIRMRGADEAPRFDDALGKLARFAEGAASPARTAKIERLARGLLKDGRRPLDEAALFDPLP